MNIRRWGFRLLVGLLVLLSSAYFGVQTYRYFNDPFSTTVVWLYRFEESMELNGCVIRDEAALTVDDGTFVRASRAEGERVSVHGTVARVYADQDALRMQTETDAVQRRLEQLRYARATATGAEVSSRMDSQIFQTLLQHRAALSAGRLDRAREQGAQLRTMILKRDYTPVDLDNLDMEIGELESTLESLQSRAEREVRKITASRSGLYSSVTDGYEALLTPATLPQLTPSSFAALDPDEQAISPAGKLVYGDYWYYAAVLPMERVEELRTRTASASPVLRFTRGIDRDFPVELYMVGDEENGRAVVVLRCKEYLSDVTLLRRQKASLVFGSMEGLRVPREALRLLPSENDEDKRQGLYCVMGTEVRFKPVEVFYTGEDFLLVRATPEASDVLRVRAGDEVIVRAHDLYDGKIVTGLGDMAR
ncbi:MAG: hypothetical protein IJR72_00590 [Oscillospiraceae bacterium]|nr:hypothetical protein [Oscillospiraceae bacterium]